MNEPGPFWPICRKFSGLKFLVDRSSCFHIICTWAIPRALLSQILKEHVVERKTPNRIAAFKDALEVGIFQCWAKRSGRPPRNQHVFRGQSFFFGKISVKGRLNWCFFHEDELFFLLFKTLIKSSKKSSSGLACKLFICGMDSCRKSWGFSQLVALGNKKNVTGSVEFFWGTSHWRDVGLHCWFNEVCNKFTDFRYKSRLKCHIYSNLIHLARCKRYTFWTP